MSTTSDLGERYRKPFSTSEEEGHNVIRNHGEEPSEAPAGSLEAANLYDKTTYRPATNIRF